MTWYFCYYVNAKYGQPYINPLDCINTDLLKESCSDLVINTGINHALQNIGTNLRMYGLGTAIILETSNEKDVTMLKLLSNSIINETKFRNEQAPVLQLIVLNPNFAKIDIICQDLELAKHHQQCSREDMEEVVRVIKRQADKLDRMGDMMEGQLSPSFKKLTGDYVTSCLNEIALQNDKHKVTAAQTTNIRKKLMHAFLPFIVYMNKDGGFK